MSKRFIVTRPLPGGGETAMRASALGLLAIPMPLQDFEPIKWDRPEGDFDALLIGSANVFRFPAPGLEKTVDLPVHAVGKQTAMMAEASGFTVATVGQGGLQSVLDSLPSHKPLRLLRVGGEERLSLEPPAHIEIVERVAYRLIEVGLTEGQAKLLRQPVCVALHSAATARIFRKNCKQFGIDLAKISIVALGPRIADVAGEGWGHIEAASTPDDASLLALAKPLCQ